MGPGNAMNPGKGTHVQSHKILGSINSWSPSMVPPGDLWTPVSCSKIYIRGMISKMFSSGKKINWRQYIQHDSIFILDVIYKWTLATWREWGQVKGLLLLFILYTSFWIISYSKHITFVIIISKIKPSKNKNYDHDCVRQYAFWVIDLEWQSNF